MELGLNTFDRRVATATVMNIEAESWCFLLQGTKQALSLLKVVEQAVAGIVFAGSLASCANGHACSFVVLSPQQFNAS